MARVARTAVPAEAPAQLLGGRYDRAPNVRLELSDRRAVAEALAFAHEHNVIHRDVSLGNVLISRSDVAAKLTDLGLA